MEYFQEEEYSQKEFDAKILRRLLIYVKPYRWRLALSVFLLLAVTGLELMGPVLTKYAIDVNIPAKDIPGLLKTVSIFFVILAVALFGHFAQIYNTRLVGQRAVLDLRMAVFSHLQKLSVSYYDRNPVGRLMTRVTSDVQVLDEMFSSGVVAVFGDIFTIIGIIIAMLVLNWKLALATFIVIPFIFYTSFIFRKHARRAFRKVRIRLARINSFLNENITGMTITQLFNLQNRNFNKFDRLNQSYLEANLNTIFYFAVFFPVIELLGSVAIALIIGYGGKLILGGMLTLGGLVAFLQYSERFFRPIRDLSEKYNILQNAMASAERIFTLLDAEPEVKSPAEPARLDKFAGQVEFRNVSFCYKDNQSALKNISFTVEPGETLAVVGRTGAGKTTLINLLCRFYDPNEGAISLDGRDIREFEPRELRRLIGLVQQDLFLFAGSIEDNICIDEGRSDYDAAKPMAVSVQADKFIASMPEGYQTKIGERGATLSTGQKQLLSFARALSVDPKILVLDEATSSVDSETEMMIQAALKTLIEGRTSIVIAHRLSTIREADRIIVLHKGEIRESGTHEELLAREGIYYKLYKMQANAFEDFAVKGER
ncbi:MAG: ABC transporter ATP-binding protein [candidate division Zixibacteria bacterium]|nr:ABC transporter ATP-binding protein [Candidatus Tariuqbacter arcticus]